MPPVTDPLQQQTAASTPPPGADPAPASLSPSDVMSDPEFLSHDGDTQRAILTRIDPEYTKMDRITQDMVISRLQRQGGRPAGRAVPDRNTLPNFTGAMGAAAQEGGNLIMGPLELAEQAAHAPIKTGVKFGKEIVAQPLRELAGEPQPGEDRAAYEKQYPADSSGFHRPGIVARTGNMLDSLIGGNPSAARESFRSGDTSGAFAHMLTVPLLTLGTGALLGAAKKDVAATRREGAAMQTISGGAITGKGPADAAARIAEQQSVVKQVLQKRGITDDTLKKMFPSRESAPQSDLVGDVARGNQLILDVARDAVGFTHAPIDAVMSRYGKQPAGAVPSRIAKSLTAQATEIGKVNPALADSITELSKKVASARTFEELNDIKSHANKMLDSVYSPVPGRAIDATAERAYAYKLAADGIRQEMYPELQKLSGSSLDLQKLGRREGDAIALRDGIYKHYLTDVAPAQAGKEASSFLEYTLAGQGAPGHSYYSKHILARGLEKSGIVPSAGAELNKKFRRATGPIGSGMTPEKVNVYPRSGPPAAPQPTVTLGNGAPGLSGMTRSITVNGKPAGHVTYDISGPALSGDTATIHHVGGPTTNYNSMSNTLGPARISQMVQQLIAAHPNVKYIQGIRVGGAQGLAARSVRVPVSKLLPKPGAALPAGISLTPYSPGRTPRFSNTKAKALAVGRGAQAVRGLTPPPSKPSEDDSEDEEK